MKPMNTFHVHNAGASEPEEWGNSKTRLIFRGESCGHGYRKNEAHIFLDDMAIAELKETLEAICQPDDLPTEPPCPSCQHWFPQHRFETIVCCTNDGQIYGDFSCYVPRDGAK